MRAWGGGRLRGPKGESERASFRGADWTKRRRLGLEDVIAGGSLQVSRHTVCSDNTRRSGEGALPMRRVSAFPWAQQLMMLLLQNGLMRTIVVESWSRPETFLLLSLMAWWFKAERSVLSVLTCFSLHNRQHITSPSCKLRGMSEPVETLEMFRTEQHVFSQPFPKRRLGHRRECRTAQPWASDDSHP